MWSTCKHRVLHNTCTKHGKDIKTQYIGSTSILLWRKDWSSIRLDRMQSSFKNHFQLIVFRKLFGWKLEKSYTRKYTCHLGLHQRSLWNTTGKELGSEHAQWPEVGQLSSSFQSNQPIPNPSRERTGRLVITHDVIKVSDNPQTRSAHESETFNVGDETLRERTERSVVDHDDLSHEQTMLNEVNMDFRNPGLPYSVVKHAQSTSVRELFRKLRTTQTDTLFNKIYDKTKPLTRLVRNQRQWFRTWATSNYLNCSRRTPKRSAKHAYHTGV